MLLVVLLGEGFGLNGRITEREWYGSGIGYDQFNPDKAGAIIGYTNLDSTPPTLILADKEFTSDGAWHTYQFQLQGNTLTLSVDGTPIVETSDNRLLSGGNMGLWGLGVQINVRSFKVIAL